MPNPRELRKARKAANEAAASLEAIEALPRRIGSKVRWRNGVIWQRAGDDDWRPVAHLVGDVEEPTDLVNREIRYTSAHVASTGFWEVKP